MQTSHRTSSSKRKSAGKNLAAKAGLRKMAKSVKSKGKKEVDGISDLTSKLKTILPVVVAVAAGAYFLRGKSAKQSLKEGIEEVL